MKSIIPYIYFSSEVMFDHKSPARLCVWSLHRVLITINSRFHTLKCALEDYHVKKSADLKIIWVLVSLTQSLELASLYCISSHLQNLTSHKASDDLPLPVPGQEQKQTTS